MDIITYYVYKLERLAKDSVLGADIYIDFLRLKTLIEDILSEDLRHI